MCFDEPIGFDVDRKNDVRAMAALIAYIEPEMIQLSPLGAAYLRLARLELGCTGTQCGNPKQRAESVPARANKSKRKKS